MENIDDLIKEIREALEEATEGKWVFCNTSGDNYMASSLSGDYVEADCLANNDKEEIACIYGDKLVVNKEDARLIENCKVYLKILLNEVDRLRKIH